MQPKTKEEIINSEPFRRLTASDINCVKSCMGRFADQETKEVGKRLGEKRGPTSDESPITQYFMTAPHLTRSTLYAFLLFLAVAWVIYSVTR